MLSSKVHGQQEAKKSSKDKLADAAKSFEDCKVCVPSSASQRQVHPPLHIPARVEFRVGFQESCLVVPIIQTTPSETHWLLGV